jgi:aspartyl-tRNA(Asn)/glutamyl-tRNA(Gln) amidotransferase subunit C
MIRLKKKPEIQLPNASILRYNSLMKLNVTHIATLANLPLTTKEEKNLGEQLTETLNYIEMLQEIDTAKIQPTAQVTGLENVTRDDVSTQSLSQKQALSNTTKQYNGFFKVDAVLANE